MVEGREAEAIRDTPAKPGEQGDRRAQGLGRVRSAGLRMADQVVVVRRVREGGEVQLAARLESRH